MLHKLYNGDWLTIPAGDDVKISPFVEIKRPTLVSLGSHVAIDWGFYCTCGLLVGDYVHIASYVGVTGGEKGLLEVGDFAQIAQGCKILTASDELMGYGLVGPTIPPKQRDVVIHGRVEMKEFSTLLTNVVVVPGIRLGQGALIGANSLVLHDIPAWEIWAGSPAKFLKKRNHEKMLEKAEELGYNYVLEK